MTSKKKLWAVVTAAFAIAGIAYGGRWLQSGSTADVPDVFTPLALRGNVSYFTAAQYVPSRHGIIFLGKSGRITTYDFDGISLRRLSAFSMEDISTENACGAFSLKLDPHFDDNAFLYVSHCDKLRRPTITRFQWKNTFDIQRTASVIYQYKEAFASTAQFMMSNVAFDNDGMMLFGLGDQRISNAAQDLSSPLGKILRLEPSRDNAKGGYTVPKDNPLRAKGQDPLIYAYGFYAPWRIAVDPQNRIWVTDHEPRGAFAEINVITKPLQNFGWSRTGSCPECVAPVIYWQDTNAEMAKYLPSSEWGNRLRIGWVGSLARDQEGADFENAILYADWCTGTMKVASMDEKNAVTTRDVGYFEMPSNVTYFSSGSWLVSKYAAAMPNACLRTKNATTETKDRWGSLWHLRL